MSVSINPVTRVVLPHLPHHNVLLEKYLLSLFTCKSKCVNDVSEN